MSAFDPPSIIALLKKLKGTLTEQKKFETEWKAEVNERVKRWSRNRTHQSQVIAQLTWEAHVVEYVNFVYKETKAHGNAKSITKSTIRPLRREIPLYGPHFKPPTYLELQKYSSAAPKIEPDTMYLKPFTVIHPFYYPELTCCPQCGATGPDVVWDGWTTTGHREVHGLRSEETALGYQLQCRRCKKAPIEDGQDRHWCFATTNRLFWQQWNHYSIPRGIPYFFQRCAVTRELFDLIAEMRLTGTAGGLGEHIKQYHLLEYRQRMLEYLKAFKLAGDHTVQALDNLLAPPRLAAFSLPWDENAYNDKSITADMITDVYQEFVERTRKDESMAYLRTLTGEGISLDATFKSASKATVVDKRQSHLKVMKGGILSVINERNEIISWRFCQTQAAAEITEVLNGIKRRCLELDVAPPGEATVDNCCTVAAAIKCALPDINVKLDVYHFMMRYLNVVIGGTRNPHRSAVANDIVGAVIKVHAEHGQPAQYWSQSEQERRLVAAYETWAQKEGVWSPAAARTHAEQLSHVQKGCLARTRQDIRTDGSRIEGSHKGWNSLMRSFSCGLENFSALGHDFVLRRNIRLAENHLSGDKRLATRRNFAESTFGSHHIGLVDQVAKLWNNLLLHQGNKGPLHLEKGLRGLPELAVVNSREVFGIVDSSHTASFGGLLSIKKQEDIEVRLFEARPLDSETLDDDSATNDTSSDATTSNSLLPASTEPAVAPVTPSTPSIPPLHPLLPSPTLSTPSDLTHRLLLPSLSPTPLTIPAMGSEIPCQLQSGEVVMVGDTHTVPLVTVHGVEPESAIVVRSEASQIVDLTGALPTTATQILGPMNSLKRKGEDLGMPSECGQDVNDTQRKKTRTESGSSRACSSSAGTVDQSRIRIGGSQGPVVISSKVYNFFQKQSTLGSPAASESSPQATSIRFATDLFTPLSLTNPKGLTRSQRLFSISTGIDFRSLSLTGKDEFTLFMNMRREQGWASFNMTSKKWVKATHDFNIRLETIDKSKGRKSFVKNPRALVDKLAEIEPQVLKRIATQHFASKTSGTEVFWKEHCYAVPLGKEMNSTKVRKTMVCTRCKTLMYPEKTGSPANHKRGHCSDGVAVKLRSDVPPPWPQPEGIFLDGISFDPFKFLQTVREIYSKVFDEKITPGNYPMEYEAFASLLSSRCEGFDGAIGFRLFEQLAMADSRDWAALTLEHNGHKYLRIDCLRNN